MDAPDVSLGRIARIAGYALVGAVGTAILATGLLVLLQPLQGHVYDAVYLAVGPWTAEETAIVLHFTLAILVAISLPTIAVAALRSGTADLRTLAVGIAGLVGLAGLFVLASAFLGVTGLLVAMVVVAAFVVTVPVGIRTVGAWPVGMSTFAGGVPVLVLFLLLLGFGLGWGGGYNLVAREVPASTVNDTAETTFDAVPQIRDDLLRPSSAADTSYCETDSDGLRTCHLSLRGYAHEAQAARFLDRHGVRCPFRGAPADEDRKRSFVAEHDGTYYRLSCVA